MERRRVIEGIEGRHGRLPEVADVAGYAVNPLRMATDATTAPCPQRTIDVLQREDLEPRWIWEMRRAIEV